ncbi:MAG: hypothetical protein GDA67_04600 [Nitrospira sp. CR1.3]|nr:hypothetical protein [Nitrospira sp. CR1.3]
MGSKLQKVGVMMVLLLGLTFSSGPSGVSADEQKKEGAGDVKERAVPRQTPGAYVGSCQCYNGRGTCKEGTPKGTCVKGDRQPCSGKCEMSKPSSLGGGSITIK